MAETHFRPALFAFLKELAKNNQKEWFDANRERYEADVREPAIRFILDFAPRLKRISPHFRADPRKNGGSLFRIYRNRRFQPKAPPYKEHTGIQFRHEAGKDAHAPGFYLHLEPGHCFIGLGTWRPDPPTLKAIREGIAEDPDGWIAASQAKTFRRHFELAGDSLTRAPRGFDPEHAMVDDLKRKDFIAVVEIPDKEVVSQGFIDEFTKRCRAGAPFIGWLCDTAGVAF